MIDEIAAPDKRSIERDLEKLSFVQWDRFTVTAKLEGRNYTFYGWIDREQDSYKDFVVLDFVFHDDNSYTQWFVTSSAKHSAEIDTILFGKDGNHSDCLRVEEHLDVANAIKL